MVQGVTDELVGEPGVFWEERAVQVGAIGVEAPGALGAIFSVVTVTDDHLAQRLRFVSELSAAAVILEADDLVDGATLRRADLDEDVPDQTRLIRPARPSVHVEDAHARQLLPLGRLIVMPHKLVAPADSQNHTPILDNDPQVSSLRTR